MTGKKEPKVRSGKAGAGRHLGLPEWEFAAREDPAFFRPYEELRARCFSDGKALPKKYREMIHLCLLAYRFAPDRTLMAHLKRAKEAGADVRELMEAFETAMIAGGVPTYIHGMNALLRLEGVIEDGEQPRRRAPAERR